MPFLSPFTKRKPIYSASVVPAVTLNSYSKRFRIVSDAAIGTELTSRKMAFTLADGITQVGYGARSFVSSGGSATFDGNALYDWPSTVGTLVGYLYYTAAATDQQNRIAALDSNYQLFQPLEDDPTGSAPQMIDWTGYARNGTIAQGAVLITSQVAHGIQVTTTFSTSHCDCGAITALDGAPQATITGLVYRPSPSTSNGAWVGRDSSSGSGRFGFQLGSDNNLYALIGSAGGSIAHSSVNAWHQYDFVFDGTLSGDANRVKLFLDGVQQSLSFFGSIPSVLPTAPLANFHIASGADPGNQSYDEVSLATTARSAAWIAFNYQDQFNNAATFTLGAEETFLAEATIQSLGYTAPSRVLDYTAPARRFDFTPDERRLDYAAPRNR